MFDIGGKQLLKERATSGPPGCRPVDPEFAISVREVKGLLKFGFFRVDRFEKLSNEQVKKVESGRRRDEAQLCIGIF